MKYLYTLTIIMLITTAAFADDGRGEARERIEPKGFLYGLGLGISHEIYVGYDYRVIPLPIIGYRGDNFRILGPFASYDALSFSDLNLTLMLAPRFQGFDDSDSDIFENMQDRKFSMDAGIGVTYEKKDWKISVSSMFDVLGRSDGFEAKVNLARVFRQGPLFFEPSLSLSYLDSKHVDYYYGVKADETNSLTFAFAGNSALNTSLGFSISTPIFLGGFTQLALNYTWYDSAITDSPIVEDETNLNVRLLFSKFF